MSDKIIKPGVTPRIIKAQAYEATMEASEIVDAAHAQARRVLEDAGDVRQAIREAAHEEGYEHGLRAWNAAIAEVHAAQDKFFASSEPELIRLAVRIAQKIIGEELRTGPEAIVTIARECLQGLRRERELILHVFPGDLERVRERIAVLREAVGPHRSLELLSDPSVGSGGCIVESEYGVIDARLETQIRCMEEVLLRAARK